MYRSRSTVIFLTLVALISRFPNSQFNAEHCILTAASLALTSTEFLRGVVIYIVYH